MLSLLCCRPKSPEGEESVLSENQHQYDEETRRVNSFFFLNKKTLNKSVGQIGIYVLIKITASVLRLL